MYRHCVENGKVVDAYKICFFCQHEAKNIGHHTYNCPFKICRRCNLRGHTSRDCEAETFWRIMAPKIFSKKLKFNALGPD